jgi:hypothetical protein
MVCLDRPFSVHLSNGQRLSCGRQARHTQTSCVPLSAVVSPLQGTPLPERPPASKRLLDGTSRLLDDKWQHALHALRFCKENVSETGALIQRAPHDTLCTIEAYLVRSG